MPSLTEIARDPLQDAAEGGAGPRVETAVLDNGMQVVVIPDRRAPVATHMVWYRTGSADDPLGKSGIAHFLEHLMFKGTERNPDGVFSRIVADLGGQENAFTSYDYTAYFQRVAKEHLPAVMGLEADRMTGLVLSDAVVAPERDVVLEERRMRVEGDPGQQLGEALMASLYAHHPYGTPIIGWMHEIEGLNRDDALAYYARAYAPDNATLVVAGDVHFDEIVRLAESHYGVHKPASSPRAPRVQEPEPRAARRVSVADPKVEQPLVQRYYLAPSVHSAAPGESEALEVLARALGGGSTSRLYRRLALESELATSVGAYYSPLAIDLSRFGIYAVPRGDVPLAEVEGALDAEIAKVVAEGLSDEDIRRAKTRLVASMVYAQDSQQALASQFGSALSIGLTVDHVRGRQARIAAVTADDVREAASRLFLPRRSVTGLLLAA